MIPGWKVKRELYRLRQQMAWYWQLAQAGRRTLQHDRDRTMLVRREDGPNPAGSRIATLLVFQPAEMPASILETCDQLTDLGYSVLVVSNGTLIGSARAALLPHVWRLLERPNLGYDFGGYREAVMHLWDEKISPDELLILNDSVWIVATVFPAFLERLKSLGADVSGAVLRSKKRRCWLESYLLRLNSVALESPAFQTFWQGYRLVDSKFGVIRQGERDFTVALNDGGLSVAALADNDGFLARLAEAPDEELRLALDYAAPISGPLGQDRAQLLQSSGGSEWRAQALGHIASVLGGKRVWNAQFPIAGIRVLDYPFVKKSREPINVDWRAQILLGVGAGIIPSPSSVVLAELTARQQEGASKQTHWAAPASSR